MAYQAIIQQIYEKIKAEDNIGQAASYIPQLTAVDTNLFGIHLVTKNHQEYGIGDRYVKFSIQSIAKCLSLCVAYKLLGSQIWKRVGVEPSGTAFNSLTQLELDKGIPRNPFINGGAMVVADMLVSAFRHPEEEFLSFIREINGDNDISYNEHIVQSEKEIGYRNIAICNFIKSYGNLENHPERVLDFYFRICSIEMTCQELANTFLFLADDNFRNSKGEAVLNMSQAKRINALMQTCGFYDESGEFSFTVGLPGKSGVGGGIIAIFPDKYSIAVWSPKLNEKGNSYRGMRFLEQFTTQTESSIF
ncbi:glutaminase [Labilibacter marinus]|uniref:glutaminase n=1 Tax=Labilibacter marinus TaxID=1477105 RepID=UPI00082D7D54|nr:glutaminase [Labilibacter marinus]